VDVRGPHLRGVLEQRLQQLDDRRVLRAEGGIEGAGAEVDQVSPRSCCSSLARPLISSVRRYTRSSATATSLSATTTGSMSFFRMRESSSKANKSVGSAMPTSIFAPRSSSARARKRRAELSGSFSATFALK